MKLSEIENKVIGVYKIEQSFTFDKIEYDPENECYIAQGKSNTYVSLKAIEKQFLQLLPNALISEVENSNKMFTNEYSISLKFILSDQIYQELEEL